MAKSPLISFAQAWSLLGEKGLVNIGFLMGVIDLGQRHFCFTFIQGLFIYRKRKRGKFYLLSVDGNLPLNINIYGDD